MKQKMEAIVNRLCLVVTPKLAFAHWVNGHDKDTIDPVKIISLKTVYMIKYSDSLSKDIITTILKKNTKKILFNQCWNWYEDKTYMPKKLSWELFTDWFDYEVIDSLLDTVKGDIEKDSVD